MDALANGLKGLANYPTTQGVPALRQVFPALFFRPKIKFP